MANVGIRWFRSSLWCGLGRDKGESRAEAGRPSSVRSAELVQVVQDAAVDQLASVDAPHEVKVLPELPAYRLAAHQVRQPLRQQRHVLSAATETGRCQQHETRHQL